MSTTPSTLSDLITEKTQATWFAELIAALALVGFPTTGWASTSVPRRILWAFAGLLKGLSDLISYVASGGLVRLATGAWLTLLADQNYDETRTAAAFAQGTFSIGDTASAGPYTIVAGQLWWSTPSGYRFTNTTGGTLALDGNLDLSVIAEFAGAAHNVAEGAVTEMTTTLPGVGPAQHTGVIAAGTAPPTVTVSGTPASEYDFEIEITTGGALGAAVFRWRTNAGAWTTGVTVAASVLLGATGVSAAFTAGTYSTDNVYTWTSGATSYNPTPGWLTTVGTDEQTDDSLQNACRTKWATLGFGANDDWYIYWTQHEPTYGSTITRVLVENGMAHSPPAPGIVDLYLATASGAPSGTVLAAIKAFMLPKVDGEITFDVKAANAVTVNVTATLEVRKGLTTTPTAAAAILAATAGLQEYFEAIQIGEDCYLDQIKDALIYDSAIVRSVVMTTPTSDVSASDHDICVLGTVTLSVSFV